ncbi:MAG: site-specific integrase [Planctomycetota bacterium]|nr:site-specific integrase [Planctomycetota bacterium]
MATRRDFGSIARDKRKSGGHRPGWYIRFRHDGKRIKRYGGPTKQIASEKLSQVHAFLSKGRSLEETLRIVFNETSAGGITFREAVGGYLTDFKGRKRPSTFAVDVTRFNAYLKNATWAKKDLADITKQDLIRWTNARERAGTSGPSINRDMALLSGLYQWAIDLEYADENPARRVPRRSESGRGRETYLAAKEARELIEESDDDFRPLFTTAIFTGMRRGELLALRWDAVDFALHLITVVPASAKTGKSRVVPMGPTLEAALTAIRTERKIVGVGTVFTNRRGVSLTKWMVQTALRKTLARCKAIPEEKRPKVTFHCLRHTAASLMVQNGVSLHDVGKILGHSTPAMTARYAHFAPEFARPAVLKLDQAVMGTGNKQERAETGA